MNTPNAMNTPDATPAVVTVTLTFEVENPEREIAAMRAYFQDVAVSAEATFGPCGTVKVEIEDTTE